MDRPIDDPHQSSPHQERDAIDGRRVATKEELETLPRVVDSLPVIVWIALVAGAAERFTFYAVSTPWRMCTVLILSVSDILEDFLVTEDLPSRQRLGSCTDDS